MRNRKGSLNLSFPMTRAFRFDRCSATWFGFVNRNMFVGVFGSDVFVRLSEADRVQILEEGASVFEPIHGRPMKEYVTMPNAWRGGSGPSSAMGYALVSGGQ